MTKNQDKQPELSKEQKEQVEKIRSLQQDLSNALKGALEHVPDDPKIKKQMEELTKQANKVQEEIVDVFFGKRK